LEKEKKATFHSYETAISVLVDSPVVSGDPKQTEAEEGMEETWITRVTRPTTGAFSF
jgi:hypothetical protein